MNDLIGISKKIYSQLQDKESKFIFSNRLLFSLTEDNNYIDRIIQSLPEKQMLDNALEKYMRHADEMVCWGADSFYGI